MNGFGSVGRNGGADAQDVLNDAYYRSTIVLRTDPKEGLDAQEIIALLKYQAHIVGRDVLDIGVGNGRTAQVLAILARAYVAIDYAPLVVAEARRTMPHLEVRLEDMRDLARWTDASVDFVFGPNNVIDAVSHADRLKTLREARRVLRDDGLCMFSSHNRLYARAEWGPQLRVSRNPVTFAWQVIRYLRSVRRHQLAKPLRRYEEDYALLDDCGPNYALLHYHIDRAAQQRQLESVGFELIDVLDRKGATVALDDIARESSALMYVARKR